MLTPQVKSSPQAFALHFAAVQTAFGDVQSVSTEQADAALHVTPTPQSAFTAQAKPFLRPEAQVREQVLLVAPQMPLSQSAAL